MKINALFLFATLTFAFTACVKEGPVGPQGPEGPQGPQGVPGSANVKRFSYTIPLSSFTRWSSTNEYWVYQSIGTTISSDDAVLVFLYEDLAGSDEWIALPMLDYWNTGNCFNAFNFSIAPNNRVQISIRNSCGAAPYSNMNSGSLSFRVFVLKGGYGLNILPEDVDINNYEQVSAALGFTD